ncbi:hypothetical protein EZV62_008299 [Acer yangbiense]|uniref:Uncharacterized protein n=1 Tax=Acer yangbiense TaxID=1000413 RepID=A0A5C7GPX1_9ROSI|nr:hypothetical protein EZV62_027866 [Acer yangbiense]TXG67024.1 hypothetical protein EZV62_008299 [Acer yangbiense]
MEEDPAQVEHEQVDHDEGINEEREQDSLVPQKPKQQFQRSIALDKPKRDCKKLERDWVESKEVTVEKVHTEQNASDYLTKPVTAEKLGRLSRYKKKHYWICIYLGANCISWASKKQPTVSRSSSEAKYRSMASTTAELTWITFLLRDIGINIKIKRCENLEVAGRCKAIRIQSMQDSGSVEISGNRSSIVGSAVV